MILYGAPYSGAPNPRRVRIFLAERHRPCRRPPVDMMAREAQEPEHRRRNSLGPGADLGAGRRDGDLETVAICRYFEEEQTEPRNVRRHLPSRSPGRHVDPRAEFMVMNPVGNFWRHAPPAHRRPADPVQRTSAKSNRGSLRGRPDVAGPRAGGPRVSDRRRLSMADICLLTTSISPSGSGLERDPALTNLAAWHARVSGRPSARA